MKTLIIRLSSLGDVLLASTVVRALRAIDPGGTIDVCTRPAYREVFAGDVRVREIILYDEQRPSATRAELRRKEKYDTVIDLHNNLRTQLLRRNLGEKLFVVNKRTIAKWMLVKTKVNILRTAPDVIGRYLETIATLGGADDGGGPEFTPVENKLSEPIEKFLSAGECIGICPGAKHFTKRWPAEKFAELCAQLIQRGKKIMLFGGEMDAGICESVLKQVCGFEKKVGGFPGLRVGEFFVNTCAQLTLSQIALAMDRCAAVVTNDSALMHLAAARKRPVVAIFGSTVREFGFVPRHNINVIEVEGLSCRPCSHIGRDACPKGHFKCMMEIDVARVVEGCMQ